MLGTVRDTAVNKISAVMECSLPTKYQAFGQVVVSKIKEMGSILFSVEGNIEKKYLIQPR